MPGISSGKRYWSGILSGKRNCFREVKEGVFSGGRNCVRDGENSDTRPLGKRNCFRDGGTGIF
jgi:hypothetical protein